MRLDNYDKWLMAGADSANDDEKDLDEYRDEIVIGCMNGDDDLPEFVTEDCSEINSNVTQLLAKYHMMDMGEEESARALLKLFYDKFLSAVERQAEFNNIWSH